MMKDRRGLSCGALITALLMVLTLAPGAWAKECPGWARVVSVEGEVEARRQGSVAWEAAFLEKTYCPGDMIRVGAQSRAALVLSSATIIRLDQHTTVTLVAPEKAGWSLIDLLTGAVHFISRVPRTLKVITPYVNAAVEGTEFLVRVAQGATLVTVFEGQVVADNRAGELTLTSGQSAAAKGGEAPAPRMLVRPRDGIQWALYYPAIVDLRADQYAGADPSGWKAAVKTSIERVRKGDLTGAFSSLQGVSEKNGEPQFYTYRAALLLSVGRIDDASRDIARSLHLAPGNSTATALQAIIALVLNEKERARTLAQNAVRTDPDSVTARIALSYARQAAFDLPGALSALQTAVQLEPENSLAWARLSELQLSLGRLDLALNAAERAVELNPRLARTQSVLGFAYLSQVETALAKEAFQQAIALDPGDPLPRMGLGLAMIREGQLSQGRREMEIATSLDPSDSLIRSYMGKAYFEEKRNGLAMSQYNMARKLDPRDPTPYFYDAIRKQSINRPVEALQEMEQAIKKNDNRGVYRSKLLLDEDLAARSASLARIYKDLGFEQLALVEGWKSVNADPGSFSAHRFLADAYAALPRHEIARVSELLQSQLLQPININPLQPRLGEGSLFILNGAGPGDLAFNEFNPLFNRDRIAVQASGIAGGNGTLGDEMVVSGIEGKFSFSAGQFHYETDGFRKNNDQEQDIYNLFAQVRLSRDTSVQAEYRNKEIDKGDSRLNFDPDDFSVVLRETEDTESIRLGLYRRVSPRSELVASYIYQDSKTSLADALPSFSISIDGSDDRSSGELLYLFRSDRVQVAAGGGHFRGDGKNVSSTEVSLPFPPFFAASTEVEKSDIRHTNLFLYSQVRFTDNLHLSLGGSADFFEGSLADRDQVNPKVGIIWNLSPATTLRAAFFRVLKRTLFTNQTLEPTQVAGFNQFFDDGEGTESWRYGVAVDHKVSKKVYMGLELAKRDLEVPFSFVPGPPAPPITEIRIVDWRERLGRAYFYWTPCSWLALRGSYEYERLDRDASFTAGIEKVRTASVPLGIHAYHPSGVGFVLSATHVDQEGSFEPSFAPTLVSGGDRFWLVDASVRYRLPKRWGLITLGVRNLFDQEFKFQETDPVNPRFQPDRLAFLKITLAP